MAVPITFKFDLTDLRQSTSETLRLLNGSDEGADEVMRDVARRVEDVMEGVGRDVSRDLKTLISVPVVHAGSRVIRSKPGEPPRRDSGRLFNSVRYVTYRARDVYTVVITTETTYDVYVNESRPFQRIIEDKWQGVIEQRLNFNELSPAQFATT